MTRSANEVMVLAGKAARGAGAPPAQAAQFGAAAVNHLAGGQAVEVLDAALAALPDGPIMNVPLAIARVLETAKGQGMLDAETLELARSYVACLPFAARLADDGTLTIDMGKPAKRLQVQRIDLSQKTYSAWTTLAARLLVPESDASRASGAGAGLTDND